MQVCLGSFVELLSGEEDANGKDRTFLMEVTELFEDVGVTTPGLFSIHLPP